MSRVKFSGAARVKTGLEEDDRLVKCVGETGRTEASGSFLTSTKAECVVELGRFDVVW